MLKFYKFGNKVTFLGNLRFGLFSDDLFFDESKYWWNYIWFQCFYEVSSTQFISIILKWNSHIYVLLVTLNEYFPPALRNVLILLHHNLYSSDFASLSGNLNKPMFVFLPIFVILCIFAHWNATVLPFSTNIKLFWSF